MDFIPMEDTIRTHRFLENAHYLKPSSWWEKQQLKVESDRDFNVLVRHIVRSGV